MARKQLIWLVLLVSLAAGCAEKASNGTSTDTAAIDGALTDADVDQYVDTFPTIFTHSNRVSKLLRTSDDPALKQKYGEALVEGRGHRSMAELANKTDELSDLQTVVLETGYKSLSEWGLVSDRILTITSGSTIVAVKLMVPLPGESKAELDRGESLFHYLEDESNSPVYREEYKLKLEELCEEICHDTADLAVVSKRYRDILKAHKDGSKAARKAGK